VDLFDLWFRWSAIKELEKRGIDATNEWTGTTEFSSYPAPKLKIQLIACFESMGEFIGADFIEQLAKLQEGNFEMKIRVGDEVVDRSRYEQIPNIKYFSERLNTVFFQTKCFLSSTRYIICGPPAFNQETPAFLREQGIVDDFIEFI
jgi:hypothetical protein